VSSVTPDQFIAAWENGLEKIHSTTTLIALKCNEGREGVIIADRRTSAGVSIYSDTTVKIRVIYKDSLVAFTGAVSTIKRTIDEFKSACFSYEDTFGDQISPDGQVSLLGMIVGESFEYSHIMRLWWDVAIPLFIAYDPLEEIIRIFDFETDGYYIERDMVGNGCGWETVKGLMNSKWKTNGKESMSTEKAIDIAIEAMYESGELNNFVSNSQLTPPTLFTVGIYGHKKIDEDRVRSLILKKKLHEEAGNGEQ
jgi:20S proteasome alpha/beta subunit